MAITDTLNSLLQVKEDIKWELEQKGQTMNDVYSTYPTAINNLQTIQKNKTIQDCLYDDIVFVDYDGTIVASYTIAQANALTALPTPPTHSGLTFYGWNWTLEDLQSITYPLNVGAIYNTTDGKTHVFLEVPDFNCSPAEEFTMTLTMIPDANNQFTIDWGDGSTVTTVSGTASTASTISHNYVGGTYEVLIDSTQTFSLGNGTSATTFITGTVYPYVKKIFFGTTCRRATAYGCYNLRGCEIISLSSNTTTLGNQYALSQNYSLKQLILPIGSGTIANYGCAYNYNCEIVCLARTNTTLNQYSFTGNYCIQRFIIPDKITSLNGNALYMSNALGLGVAAMHYFRGPKIATFAQAMTMTFPLRKFAIGTGVTTMNSNLGDSTSYLTSITIPSTVTSLGSSFRFPKNVYSIIMLNSTPPTITSNGIGSVGSSTRIFVPSGSVDTYKGASQWSTKSSQIYPIVASS